MTLLEKKQARESYLFIKAQLNALDTSKYIESEKAKRDLFFDEKGSPTQAFYMWWIDNHAENFRNAWPTSLCRSCSNVMSCKDCLKEACQKFKERAEEEELQLLREACQSYNDLVKEEGVCGVFR